MKREGLVLNAVCVVLAVGFLLFAAYTFVSAGSVPAFLSVDSLFFFTFSLLMAALFLSVAVSGLMTLGIIRNPLNRGKAGAPAVAGRTAAAPALPRGTSAPPLRAGAAPTPSATMGEPVRDAKGRPVPPDVQRVLAEMKKSGDTPQ
jgi:hypothetical protein